jgi:hypothetical protein
MINNLGNSDLAVQGIAFKKESLCCNICTNATKLMLNWSWILNFQQPSKATIVSMVTSLSKPLDHNEPFELESDNETAEVENDLQLSMQEKLTRAIDKEMSSKICSKSRTTKDVMDIVKKELAIFEVEGKRGANLVNCYENSNSTT